jgi:hypothetical protein
MLQLTLAPLFAFSFRLQLATPGPGDSTDFERGALTDDLL